MNIAKADALIERLEILADDHSYPIESDRDYKILCKIVSRKKVGEELDAEEVMEYYKSIIKNMKEYF